jgi:hypothetical protein
LVGLALDAGVILAFSCVMIVAGHGLGPIGFVMFAGSAKDWGIPMTIGWTGIALLAISALVPRSWLYGCLALSGLSMIVISWSVFVSLSVSMSYSMVFSIPLFCALTGRLLYVFVQLRESHLPV